MDEIKKFSKEWFVAYGSQKTKDAAKNLKPGVDNNVTGIFNKDFFWGDRKDVDGWLNLSPKGAAMREAISQYGGMDNLFELIDTDNDADLSLEEAAAIAGTNTPEDAEKLDRKFTSDDLKLIYENVTEAEEAEVSGDNTRKIYTFKDGSKTEVEYDSNGNVQKTIVSKKDENGNTVKTTYDSKGKKLSVDTGTGEKQDINITDNNLKIVNTKDKQGRVIKQEITGKNEYDNKTVETEYHKDGSKTVKTTTIGRETTEKFDKTDKLVNKEEIYMYEQGIGALDGVIEETNQGQEGDCWLLSGMNSLARTEIGRQMIKDAIHKNDDGSVTITLKGANKSYTYTPEQLVSYDYAVSPFYTATGDYDMNLIERAFSDYRRELLQDDTIKKPRSMKLASQNRPLYCGTGEEAIEVLTGKKGFTSADPAKIRSDIDNFTKDPERYGIVVNFRKDDPSIYCEEAVMFGNRREDVVEIIANHAYTVNRVDDEYVYVKDPKDSSWEIPYPKEKFFENTIQCSITDLK